MSSDSLKVQHYRLKNFGCDIDGDPIQNSTVAADNGPLVYRVDVAHALDKLVDRGQLTSGVRTLIAEQLGL